MQVKGATLLISGVDLLKCKKWEALKPHPFSEISSFSAEHHQGSQLYDISKRPGFEKMMSKTLCVLQKYKELFPLLSVCLW